MQKLHAEGDPLIGLSKRNKAITKAMQYHFGTIVKALEAAGFNYKKLQEEVPRENYSKKTIILELQELNRQGKLSCAENMKKNYYQLYNSCAHHYRSYKRALEAAGFDPSKLKKRQPLYTPESLIFKLQELHRQGKLTYPSKMQKLFPKIYNACSKYLISYRKAVEAAGIDYQAIKNKRKEELPQESPLKEKLIAKLQELHSMGLLSRSGQMKENYRKLYNSCAYHYKSYKRAVEAAGIDYQAIRNKRKKEK